jgi:hypothetical protein
MPSVVVIAVKVLQGRRHDQIDALGCELFKVDMRSRMSRLHIIFLPSHLSCLRRDRLLFVIYIFSNPASA